MLLRKLFIILPLLLLSSCGFRPLLSESQPTTKALNSVEVSIIRDREGQQLRNRLLDFMNPHGYAINTKYRLDVQLVEAKRELSFRKDLVARRQELSLKAYFNVVDLNTGKVIFKNFSESYNSFSLGPKSDFASFSSYISEKSARERMVEILAQDIRLQVGSFLLHHEQVRKNENHTG